MCCSCGCALALAMAEAEQRMIVEKASAAPADAFSPPGNAGPAARSGRGWEALKRSMKSLMNVERCLGSAKPMNARVL